MAFDLVSPATESLLFIGDDDRWPQEIKYSRKLKEQADDRIHLSDALSKIFSCLARTDQDISDAIDEHLIGPDDVIEAYEQLARFLEADPCHARIILYLPFELLPRASWQHTSKTLMNAIDRFIEAYMQCWYDMLSVSDVRANFTYGDVWEPELRAGPLPRVVKAAHFIPWLVEKGLLSVPDIFQILNNDPRSVLRNSVADTLPLMVDMGSLSRLDLERITMSYDMDTNVPKNVAVIPGPITEARMSWLRREERADEIEKLSVHIAREVTGLMTPDAFREWIAQNDLHKISAVHGVRMALEITARSNLGLACAMYITYEKAILALQNDDSPEVRDAVVCAWSHLFHAGLLEDSYIENTFGFKPVCLDEPFQEKRQALDEETRPLMSVIEAIENNPELSRYVYPACVLFGSRIKGYGAGGADLDVAVFIRPGVAFAERSGLKHILSDLFSHEKIGGKVVEFWLQDDGNTLKVRNLESADASVAESTWTHVLFGGAWYGKPETIQELHRKLLPGYLYTGDKSATENDLRRIWLEEMERDAIQYRLLHKGYARFFPVRSGICTANIDRIDGLSVFYDPGFRRLATRLFITKVFLPQLTAQKKIE